MVFIRISGFCKFEETQQTYIGFTFDYFNTEEAVMNKDILDVELSWVAYSPELLIERGYLFELIETTITELGDQYHSMEYTISSKFSTSDATTQTASCFWAVRPYPKCLTTMTNS